MKIVVLDGFTLNPGDLSWAGLAALGELQVYDRTKPEQVTERIGKAEIVFTNKTPITATTLERCPQIRFIGELATGYNNIDVAAARKRGIPVTNIPAYSTDAVAQFTIALLLELCSRVGEHSRAVQNGQWTKSVDWCFWRQPLMELAGKQLGIIGFGRIGQRTAQIATALGMDILAYSKTRKPELETAVCRYVELDELLAKADVISLHCPLFPATQGLINQQTIAKMKDGVLLINTARGQLIVEEDLRDGLNTGKIGGAAVDVVSMEPIPADSPLLQAKNIIITPHIAWAPLESRQRLMDTAVANLKAFLAGQPINVVN